jgi:hypothetical protein
VIINVGRRAVEAVVVTFAVLGFVFVPLGKKTGLEHARAIAASRAAVDAAQELLAASGKLREQMFQMLRSDGPPESRAARKEPARGKSEATQR